MNIINQKSKYETINTYRGYNYAIWLNIDRGYRCGYVQLPENHSLYNKHFRDIDLDTIQLTFSGRLKDLSGYYVGWDHNHSWDGVDEDVIYANYPEEDAERLINDARAYKDEFGMVSTLSDLERECHNVIDELISKFR